MKFEILAERPGEGKATFFYDNQTNTITDADGVALEYTEGEGGGNCSHVKPYKSFDKNRPLRKTRQTRLLKIQMGLSCNYSCDYCSQKFVERPKETSKKDIEAFLAKLDNLEFDESQGLKVEFWGGEPLVYWKTLKPLAEALADRFAHWKKKPLFSIITNGSLLNKEICAWLCYMGFSVGISHDGPGQSVRGPDPFEDEEKKKTILEFYRVMKGEGRISFNAILTKQNQSRAAIHQWFQELTGDENVAIGEGIIVDAYDADGIQNSLQGFEEHFAFRRKAFAEIFEHGSKLNFPSILGKIDGFTRSVLTHSPMEGLGQKCGMDNEDVIAIDLRGNVITCQNVSAVEIAGNGESHLGGTLEDFDNIEIKGATHWSNRAHCAACPVLHLCQGSCMFLDGETWETSCSNAYSDNVAMFALSFQMITGYIPVLINGEGLPNERRDIFGTILQHTEPKKRKVFSIKVVADKTQVVNDVAVYAKAAVAQE
jgi:uncharacterized protein